MIADRLIDLLPRLSAATADGGSTGGVHQATNGVGIWLIWLALGALVFMMVKSGLIF